MKKAKTFVTSNKFGAVKKPTVLEEKKKQAKSDHDSIQEEKCEISS
jgi:hypothetical protein